MYCSQCATPLSETDVYCPKCSKPVASFSFSDSIPQVEPLGETPTVVHSRPVQKKATWPAAAIGAIAGSIVTLAIGGLLLLLYLQSNRGQQNASAVNANSNIAKPSDTPKPVKSETPQIAEANTATPTPPPSPKVQIVNEQFPVPARRTAAFPFTVTADAHVTGGFVAYGGSNDIDAMLVSDRGGMFYHSGYTSKGKINVLLHAGSYTLIFDNRRAWLTDKSVAAEIYYQEQ